jgi:glycosyltransferase involved in cell wall biosynthesis
MKVAIVHEWLVNFRGSERVLLELARMFPDAVIYVSVLDRSKLPAELAKRDIRTTYIQRLPFAKRWYQKYLPLMPKAYEELNLNDYDLIISSSHACAKGIIPPPHATHVCYCYTPMRYAWSGYLEYKSSLSSHLMKWVMSHFMHRLRQWDVSTASRVDQFIACSTEIQRRVKRYYRRDSVVVFPPVEVGKSDSKLGNSSSAQKLLDQLSGRPYYLSLGRLVPYKRIDIAVDACTRLNRDLVVAGSGSKLNELRKRAGPTIHFIEDFTDDDATLLYSSCEAFLFPGMEDFGITVVEAQSHGKPVIAYGYGGVEDTVLENKTGILFYEQTSDAMVKAILELEDTEFKTDDIVAHANNFSSSAFQSKILEIVNCVHTEGMFS